MINLINLVLDLFRQRNLIKVRRLPPTKTLYINLLGLTFGLFVVLLVSCLNYSALFNDSIWLTLIALAFFSFFTYYLGVFFVILLFLLYIVHWLPASIRILSALYLWGYAFGWILAMLYNFLVYLHLIIFEEKRIKIVFAYDKKKELNIIKSPDETQEAAMLKVLRPIIYYVKNIRDKIERDRNAEDLVDLIKKAHSMMPQSQDDKTELEQILGGNPETSFAEELKDKLARGDKDLLESVEKRIEPLIEKYLKLKDPKLYNYKLDAPPKHPYTIAFVANPQILRSIDKKHPIPWYDKDLIIYNLKLFLRSVHKALLSFERDEVLGRPEIWSRVRVITIFDKKLADASDDNSSLVTESRPEVMLDDKVAENLISPRPNMFENVKTMLTNYHSSIPFEEIDVIFALTASLTHIRSTSYYSDWYENTETTRQPPIQGKAFQYDPAPDKWIGRPSPFHVHDDFAEQPGRVAVNVLSASRHTYIHEFAHAMSSAACGAICDEYYDKAIIEGGPENVSTPFYVNRKERAVPQNSGQFDPVHPIFAEYEHVVFCSDLNHPSAEENWIGYFPERHHPGVICTMDRTITPYRFDKLISQFMYDRLAAKLNRKK
jgi:hypothetical protein